MHLLIATANAHKADEIRAILQGSGLVVETLLDHPDLPEAPETGDTFEANALEKARFIHAHTGRTVVADDSGLEVDALGGAPGVHSKRYSDAGTHEANNTKLLAALDGVSDRAARFCCVMAVVADGFEDTVRGDCDGTIATALRGTGGFGYDPLFLPDQLGGRTMAEATIVEKNTISHRGRAFRQLPEVLSRAGLLDVRGRHAASR